MEKLLSEMKMKWKYNRTISKEDLDPGMEYTIKGLKCVKTKYGKKIVFIIDFKGKMVDLFAPWNFDCNAVVVKRN